MSAYRACIAVIGLWCGVHTMAILTSPELVGFTQLYLLVTPYFGLVLGYWFYQEYNLKLLGDALSSLVRSKAAKSEQTGQQDK